jgi:thiol-disulfide isomerase/thioredoxin
MSQRVLVLTIIGLSLCGRVIAAPLGVGSPAPKIEVQEFIKGEPVNYFESGKIYVVEFWATWCPPCRTSIPHLTEMQKKYKDVVFIGVSVSEQNWNGVKPFVEQMGEKMDYRVAMDGRAGKMSKNWMQAAAQNGIPTAFIVSGEGKIAWIGHPMQMEKRLGEIVAQNPAAASPTPPIDPKPQNPTPPTTNETSPPKKEELKPVVESKAKEESKSVVESKPDSTPSSPEPKSKLPWIIVFIAVVGGGACLVFVIAKLRTRDSDYDEEEDERPRKKRKKESNQGREGREKPRKNVKRIVAEED